MCQNVAITCRYCEKEDANKFGGDEEGHWHTHGQLIGGGEFEQGGCCNATWNPSQGVLLSNNTLLLISYLHHLYWTIYNRIMAPKFMLQLWISCPTMMELKFGRSILHFTMHCTIVSLDLHH